MAFEAARSYLGNTSGQSSRPDLDPDPLSADEASLDEPEEDEPQDEDVVANALHLTAGEGSLTEHGSIRTSDSDEEQDVPDPVEPVSTSEAVRLGYPPLDYRFGILSSWMLIVTHVFWLVVISGVVSLTVLDGTNPTSMHLKSRSNYYGLRYGPSIVGTVTTIWWRAIAQNYNRLIPYVKLANVRITAQGEDPKEALAAQRLNGLDAEDVDSTTLANLWASRQFTASAVNLTTIGLVFLVPLKASFLQITRDPAGWDVDVAPAIGWLITAFYLGIYATTFAITVQLWGIETGLKWNPCSLAAQIALLQYSNVPKACEGLEFETRRAAERRVRDWAGRYGTLRLGYWRDRREPDKIFHSIRFLEPRRVPEPNGESSQAQSGPRQQGANGRRSDQRPKVILGEGVYPPDQGPVAYFGSARDRSRFSKSLEDTRYWNLMPSIYLLDNFILALCVFLVAGLVVLAIFLHSGSIFRPHSYSGFAPNSFVRSLVFSFLPSLVLAWSNVCISQSDRYHRMLQPIRGMDKRAPPRDNVLIDYLSPDPITTIFTALSRGHLRIAWGCFLAQICSVGPIVSGSMFTFNLDDQVFWASPLPAYAVLGIVCAYIIALPVARPDPKYAAGRGLWNIIDTLSFVYDSPVLQGPEFTAQDKTDVQDIHLFYRVVLQKELYQFGYYLGRSGRRRLGISTATKANIGPDGGPEVADGGVDRIKSRYRFLRFNFAWFRRPMVLGGPTPGVRRADTEMRVGESPEDEDKGGQEDHVEQNSAIGLVDGESEGARVTTTTIHQVPSRDHGGTDPAETDSSRSASGPEPPRAASGSGGSRDEEKTRQSS